MHLCLMPSLRGYWSSSKGLQPTVCSFSIWKKKKNNYKCFGVYGSLCPYHKAGTQIQINMKILGSKQTVHCSVIVFCQHTSSLVICQIRTVKAHSLIWSGDSTIRFLLVFLAKISSHITSTTRCDVNWMLCANILTTRCWNCWINSLHKYDA